MSHIYNVQIYIKKKNSLQIGLFHDQFQFQSTIICNKMVSLAAGSLTVFYIRLAKGFLSLLRTFSVTDCTITPVYSWILKLRSYLGVSRKVGKYYCDIVSCPKNILRTVVFSGSSVW